MEKTIRPIQNGLFLLLGRTSWDEWTPLICRKKPDHAICRDNPGRKAAQELGRSVIQRLVSASCADVAGVGDVQARILITQPPPWSRRNEPGEAGQTRYLTYPWMAFVPWSWH